MSDLRRLEEVQFTTSWRRLIYDFLRTSDLRRHEHVRFTSSWRRPIYDLLKTSDLRYLVDVWFTTSWNRPFYDSLKTPVKWRLCSNVVVASMQCRKKWLFLILYSVKYSLTFSCGRSLSMNWSLYDRDLRHERVNHT